MEPENTGSTPAANAPHGVHHSLPFDTGRCGPISSNNFGNQGGLWDNTSFGDCGNRKRSSSDAKLIPDGAVGRLQSDGGGTSGLGRSISSIGISDPRGLDPSGGGGWRWCVLCRFLDVGEHPHDATCEQPCCPDCQSAEPLIACKFYICRPCAELAIDSVSYRIGEVDQYDCA